MQRTAMINGATVTYDKDYSLPAVALMTPGVVEGLEVTTNSVAPWKAFIEVTRTSVTPNETFYIQYENTSAVTIDTSWDKKVFIAIPKANINDSWYNGATWEGIAIIQTGASYPTEDYIPLASITGGVITDERDTIRVKQSIEENWILLPKCTVQNKTANYTFIGSEKNNTWFSTSTAGGNVTYTLNPWLFDLAKWLFEFTFCKSTSDTNKVIIDVWGWKTIDWSQTYEILNQWETVTLKIVTSTFVKVVATSNRIPNITIPTTFPVWDWSDWNVTISVNTTLTRDMFYNNLTINSTIVLDPAGYTIYVAWTLTNNWIIRRNWNNWSNWWNATTGWSTAWAGGTALATWRLGGVVAGANGWEGATWWGSASAGGAGTSYSYTYLKSNGANWGAGTGWVPGGGWAGGTSNLVNLYTNLNILLTTIVSFTCILLPLMISWWAWGGGGNKSTTSSGTWYKWPGGGWGGGSWWPIVIFCWTLAGASWIIESKWWNWWNWGVNAIYGQYGWGGGWWAGGIIVIWCLDKNYANKWTVTVTGGTWGYSGATKTWTDWQTGKIILLNS